MFEKFSIKKADGCLAINCASASWLAAATLAIATALPLPALAACNTTTPCVTAPLDLGTLDLGSVSKGVNADGSVVVGYNTGDSNDQAFRWTQATGMVALTGAGFAASLSQANGVSADGSVVVGQGYSTTFLTLHAFRWTQATGMVDIQSGPFNSSSISNAAGVSADGSVVVGTGTYANNVQHAFRWTQATGMIDIHSVFSGDSTATGVSGDGAVVVGYGALNLFSGVHAFRWTQATGMVDIHDSAVFGGAGSLAYGVNGDGSVVVGYGFTSANATHAFRWTPAGMVDIHNDAIFNEHFSQATGVSSNGAVVVGVGRANHDTRAFRWTQATGMQDLNTLLSNAGVNMSGIVLRDAQAVSGNGQFITGLISPTSYLVRYDDGDGASAASGSSAGLSTLQGQQDSVNGIANQRSGVMSQQQGLAAPLLGANQPMGGGSEAGMFASTGSASAGGTARYSNGHGLSFIGGLAWAREDYARADLRNSYVGAGAAQYVYDGFSFLRPFVEGGGWISPDAQFSFTREYANGAGTASGSGNTKGTLAYVYGRGGVLLMANESSQLALSGEYGREQLRMAAYAENTTANPFNAASSAGTDRMDVAKARVSLSRQFDARFDATLWAAQAWGFHRYSDVVTTVTGFGALTPTALSDTRWTEYGARLGYKMTEAMTLDVFANGVSGGGTIGTRIHSGAGLRAKF